jgi:hypothetical protein
LHAKNVQQDPQQRAQKGLKPWHPPRLLENTDDLMLPRSGLYARGAYGTALGAMGWMGPGWVFTGAFGFEFSGEGGYPAAPPPPALWDALGALDLEGEGVPSSRTLRGERGG